MSWPSTTSVPGAGRPGSSWRVLPEPGSARVPRVMGAPRGWSTACTKVCCFSCDGVLDSPCAARLGANQIAVWSSMTPRCSTLLRLKFGVRSRAVAEQAAVGGRAFRVLLALMVACALPLVGGNALLRPSVARADVGAPPWWNGDCDANHWNPAAAAMGWTGAGAHRLGASYLGVPVCGPRPLVDGAPDVRWTKGGWGEFEWECPELVFRFMAQIYGVSAYSANGDTVVSNYSTADGGGLVKVSNGTVGVAPQPGDVISFNGPGGGHVGVVASSSVDGSGNGSITMMSENDTANGWRTLTVSSWRVQGFGTRTPYGWLHDPLGRGSAGGPPPPDTDGDGVPDIADVCPSVPGLPAFAGCPADLGEIQPTSRVDFNGDGRADYCRVVGIPGNGHVSCTLSTGTGFGSTITSPALDWGYDTGRAWVDVNGDGKADYCRRVGGTNLTSSYVSCTLSAGSAFGATITSPLLDWGYDTGRAWVGASPPPRRLSVSKSGSGSGTVASSPSGINCGNACSHNFRTGTTVVLKAIAASGSTFAGWSGACSGTGKCTLTLTSAAAVTAGFTKVAEAKRTLSVSRSGNGTGTVTSSPTGIDCGTACSHTYPSGARVTLKASTAKGSRFAGWSGACAGSGACTLTMSASKSVKASFFRTCVVPAVKGETLRAAKRTLTTWGCRVGRIKRVDSRTVKKGRVIAQKPHPHKHLGPRAKVSLVVSKGRP